MQIFIITLILFLLVFWGITLKKYHSLQHSIAYMTEVLGEIESGNTNRKILTHNSDETKELGLLFNKIIRKQQNKINHYKTSERKYKDLMINLSHDVRTPLASMLGYLELLPTSDLPASSVSSIDVITKKAYQLKDFIDMLFQWTKLDADEEYFIMSTYDLAELSRNVLSNWIGSLEGRDIRYKISISNEPILCSVDPIAYERIISNIIKNIIHHSHATSLAFILETNNSEIILQIKDNGVGIKETEQSLVFKRLYRCSSSRPSNGNGLGLAIVNELIYKMNGQIALTSVPNVYTVFTITFPLTKTGLSSL